MQRHLHVLDFVNPLYIWQIDFLHPYHLDESISIFQLAMSGAFFYFDFIFNRISCKQTV